jgi:hypothetical protein
MLIAQLEAALHFNSTFCSAYIRTLEGCEDLQILDIWILLCLYGIAYKRQKTCDLIKLLAKDKLTPENAEEAVRGHGKVLHSVLHTSPDLVSWCLRQPSDEVVAIGDSWARCIFGEITDRTIQQDLVGDLCMLVSTGAEGAQLTAAKVLANLCKDHPETLSAYALLIEGLIFSYEGLSFDAFKLVISTLVKITLLTPVCVTQEATLCVFIRKRMASPALDARKAGVLTAATFLNRVAGFCETGDVDMDFFSTQFTEDLQAIVADPVCTDLFFEELAGNPNRGADVNDFFASHLRAEILGLRREIAADDYIWFNTDDSSVCIDFSPMTLKGRVLATNQNQNVVYVRGGLRLYLDCIRERELDLMAEFAANEALRNQGAVPKSEDKQLKRMLVINQFS